MAYLLARALERVFRAKGWAFPFQPWESETEIVFRRAVAAGVRDGLQVQSQVAAPSSFATFYLDMLVRDGPGGRAIAVECDGPWHNDFLRDFCRDCLCVGNKYVAAIYRFSHAALVRKRGQCLAALHHAEPWIFRPSFAAALDGLYPQGARLETSCTRVSAEDKRLLGFLRFARACRGLAFSRFVERYRQHLENLEADGSGAGAG